MANRLAAETSPYLLQHANNPVDWYAWGPEAFAEARRTERPVLLSIGYAACHWCHVMAHESFEDEAVAQVMNELFVNIKVDREERPDVDQLYMNALHLLGVQGGWPLTVFLDADANPIWGGTYFPRTRRWGRPSFVEVMQEFARVYREAPDRIDHNRRALATAMSRAGAGRPSGELSPELLRAVTARLYSVFDHDNGGLPGAPKFPQASLLTLLWHAGMAPDGSAARDTVLHTLRRISRGGIYDHLGGGYARYSVDSRWLVPHFEKMLYDNAQLVELLTNAWLATRDGLFRERIEETVGWLLREMRLGNGAFASSLDADTQGEEGTFYVWTISELADVLGPDLDTFTEAYGATRDGNFEGRNVLHRLAEPYPLDNDTEALLARCRARLYVSRATRPRPPLDDKILADWNALTIAALARAAIALDRPEWLDSALAAYRFIYESMSCGRRLAHCYRNGRLQYPGVATDHAAMATAALALHEALQESEYLDHARDWLDTLDEWHLHEDGGYTLAARDADALPYRILTASDDAVPNANGLAATALVRLSHLTGDETLLQRADRIFTAFGRDIAANPLAHASLLSAFDLRLHPVQIVITGTDTETHLRAARTVPDPNRIILRVLSGERLPDSHPARHDHDGMTAVTTRVCHDRTCSLPVTDASRIPETARRPA